MLRRHRKLFAPLAALLLALPLLIGIAAPDTALMAAEELRPPAPLPAMPHSFAALPATLRAADAWLAGHFGLRRAMVHAQAVLARLVLRTGNDDVLIGRDDWYFLLNYEQTMQQTNGLLVRVPLVTAAADMLASMRRVLAAEGSRLVVAFPPNPATIYPEHLPKWARNPGRPTEYDLLLKLLDERGVPAVDLRPVMLAAKAGGKLYYKHDTHWTPRGTMAGYNAVVEAAGLPDWRVSAADALWPPVLVPGGDTARMLGIRVDVGEPLEFARTPVRRFHQLTADRLLPNEITSDLPGPTVLIIGDSYELATFKDLVALHAGRVIWMYHYGCGFDWRWVEQFHAPQVWYIATEREAICLPGQYPAGLDAAAAALGGSPKN